MAEFNRTLFERGMDIIPCINQADTNGTTTTGDWIKVRDYTRVGFLMAKYGTEDVDDQSLQFLQATAAAGTSSKALSVPIGAFTAYKTGTLTSQTVWVQVAITAAIDGLAFGNTVPTGHTRWLADATTDAVLIYAEFQTTDLDVDGGFDFVTAYFGNNANNALLISVWTILMGGSYPKLIPLSAIS